MNTLEIIKWDDEKVARHCASCLPYLPNKEEIQEFMVKHKITKLTSTYCEKCCAILNAEIDALTK